MAEKKEAKKNYHVLYLGVDKRYSESLEAKLLQEYEGQSFEINFEKFYKVNDDNFVELVEKILNSTADLILLDYSFQSESVMKAVYLVKQMAPERPMITLYDHQNKVSQREDCLLYNVVLNHLKSGEDNLNVLYSLCYLMFREKTNEPKVTQCKMKEPEPCKTVDKSRIVYLSKDGPKIETRNLLISGDIIDLDIKIDEKIIPSKKYIVKKVGSDGIHYSSKKYWAYLNFAYIDPIPLPARASKLDKLKNQDDNSKIIVQIDEEIKPAVALWFDEQILPKNHPLKTPFLVIDPKMQIFKNNSHELWKFKEVMRFKSNTSNLLKEFEHYKPVIIAFQFEEKIELTDEEKKQGQKELPVNDVNSLKELVKTIKQVKGYLPYLFIFNYAAKNSEELKKLLDYPNIISSKDVITSLHIQKCIALLEKKNEEGFNIENEGNVFIPLDDQLSTAGFNHKIDIVNMNELAFEFSSKEKFNLYETFYMEEPVKTYFTIVPHRVNSPFEKNDNIYRGIFHSFDDEQKKGIRKYVISKK